MALVIWVAVIVTAIDNGSWEEPPVLSTSQRRLWFLNQYDEGDAYVIARATRFRGRMDLAALRAAHQLIADRHEILRTLFENRAGVATAVIDPPGPIDFTVEDVVEGHARLGHRTVDEFLADASRTPFDLAHGPVWRIRVGRLSPDDHIVVTAIHHVAADGWSFPVLREEVSIGYRALVAGRAPDLPPLHSQYRNHARGEVSRAASLEFWEQRFGDDPDPLPLLGDRLRPHRRSQDGGWADVGPLNATSAELQRLAARCGGSPFMVGLAIFSAFLGRIGRTDEVIIGIPYAERGDPATHGLIGPFVNTLPLRFAVRPGTSLLDQVAIVRTEMLGALDHAEVPFEDIVTAARPRRDPSHTPLFQVMYQLHDGAFRSRYDLPGLSETNVPLVGTTSKFDLVLELNSVGGPVTGSLNFSTDLFDTDTGVALARAFTRMADAALNEPEADLDRLPLLDRWEQRWLVGELNASQRDYPKTSRLWDLFEAVARAHEDNTAVAEGNGSMTYRELRAAARSVASKLRQAGLGRGEPVGLEMERSMTLVAATLGVIAAGGVYVPLDPSYPETRRRKMIEQSGLRYVLRASGDEVDLVPTGPVDSVALGSDAAYVMFTSGSTGQPKGTVIPHRAVARLVRNTDYVTLQPGDVVGHVSNASFDAATFEIWGALLNGATLRVLDSATVIDPAALAAALTRYRITTIFVTTALFNLVASHEPAAFAPVRDVLFGGERCNVDAVAAVLASGPPERLVHVYGPTESTTFASWYEVPRDFSDSEEVPRTIPIGGPVTNTTLYVVDRGGQLVPPGVVGELWIGGDGLAAGYLGDPELTAERFGADPFGEDPWGRLYHTGDLVWRRPDGAIEFVGRTDRQVKIRGFRVEPEEVERAIRSHPDVCDAMVAVISLDGDPTLTAWAVPVDGRTTDSATLLAHLRGVLPSYTVPASVGIIPKLPLGPNGKVEMSLLPVPFEPLASFEGSIDPATAGMIEVFEQILGVKGVGPGDSFFDLGGHSLLAVELISLAERRMGHRVPLAALFEDPTPVGLARLIENREQADDGGIVTFVAGDANTPVFLFHHPSGTVLAYEPLARRIEAGRAVFGLQARGIDGIGRPPETIEDMAEEYADRIERVCPTGGCILAGHSLGGLLAWETARTLRRRGRDVALLALLDSRIPRPGWVEVDGEVRQLTLLGRARRRIRRLGGDLYYGGRYASHSIRRRAIPPGLARTRQIRSSSRAFEAYKPGPLDQRVVFFAARGSGHGAEHGTEPSDRGWRNLAGSIEVVTVPGTHTGVDSVLAEPNVDVLAGELRTRIQQVISGTVGHPAAPPGHARTGDPDDTDLENPARGGRYDHGWNPRARKEDGLASRRLIG